MKRTRKLFHDGSISELLLAAGVAAAVVMLASVEVRSEPAQSDTPSSRCMPSAIAEHILISKYNEAPAGMGLNNKGNLLQFWVAQDGTSWTIMLASPKGISCIMDAGYDWMATKKQPMGDPS